MVIAGQTRQVVPSVNPKLLPLVAFVAAEAWFLGTQTAAIIVPLIWLMPLNLFLFSSAVGDSVAMKQMALVLFFGRIPLLPYMFLSQMGSIFTFYFLFMAPVDAFIVVDVLRKSIGR
jgi:hypothetical protein